MTKNVSNKENYEKLVNDKNQVITSEMTNS